jgi:CheY-like chemotaxis protein
VVTAAGGLEGLKLAKELRPIAITLDVMMPDLDGWSVLAALRQDPAPSSVRVRALHPAPQAHRHIRYTASVLGRMREVPMRDERLEVSVSFDERRGYVAKSACRAPGRSRVLLAGAVHPSLRWEEKSNVGSAIGGSKPPWPCQWCANAPPRRADHARVQRRDGPMSGTCDRTGGRR